MTEKKNEHRFGQEDGRSYVLVWEEDALVCSQGVGDLDEDSARSSCDHYDAILRQRGAPYNYLSDASEVQSITPGARKIFNDRLMLVEGSPFKKMAVFGCNFFIRTMIDFYARLSKVPIRAFKTRKDAIAWLGQEDAR